MRGNLRGRSRSFFALTASLARTALGADAASAGADHFVASTMRADDVHEHIAERFFHPLRMSVARAEYFRVAFARRIVRDHIDQFFLGRTR
jgi:predicted nuclease with TOPRIM domain